MHAWEAIAKTLEIIEERIDEDIPIEELAETAALSLFYYQRLFTLLVKKPVREYIKLRRLARATEALRNENKKIIDIALTYGFTSHEVFTRAFRVSYGMTPKEYKKSNIRLNSFSKPDLFIRHTMIDVGVPLISDGLVLVINRKRLEKPVTFMGIEAYVPINAQFPVGQATGVDVPGETWERYWQLEKQIPRITNGRRIGVAYHGKAPEGCFPYFTGSEVDAKTKPGKDTKTWTLPAAEYLVCYFEAENFEDLVTMAVLKGFNYVGLWQEQKGLKPGDFGAEIYYEDTEREDFAYMEIWTPWIED